jgi:hypothetical protein
MPQSLAAGRGWGDCKPAPIGISVVFFQFDAALENVPQTGKDRLVGAAGCFPHPLPVAFTGSTREAANEAGGEQAARKVPLRRIARNALREITSYRGDRSARDVWIGAGPKDLADDHWQPPSRVVVAHLMPSEFVLNVSLL